MKSGSRRIVEVLGGQVEVGAEVVIEGWVRTRRDSKAGLSFVHVHDGSCFAPLQVVAPGALANYEAEVLRLTSGCSVRVRGVVVESQGKGQALEVEARALEVLGWVEDPDTYPMPQKRHSMEHLRTYAHLRPRTNLIGAITRVRHTLAQAVHRFFDARGFYWIHTPIVTTSDAEGAGEMFRVSTLDLANLPRTPEGAIDFTQDFFGREAFLTVSGQLNVEAYCLAMSRVYTFGPTFRAENSHTRRHLAEFWMIEPELAFAALDDDVALAVDFLKSIFGALLEERADDLGFFASHVDTAEPRCIERLERLVRADFERMSYGDAIAHLEKAATKFEFPVRWGVDLQSEHERWLTEEVVRGPVVVTDYPREIKAFYMRQNEDGRTVAAMDVLAPGIGEIIGGSQREERLDVLDARIREMGLDPSHYGWYRDLRRYGTVPHAGFGLGFERAIQYATGVDNIRDVIPFPRAAGQAEF
ncbi:MAG: asparagine--tRNA ligase [Sandaracinaceae bacterium]|nr:asparagine--tRNA ligase [Sandaracinaceae bacterium]